MTPLKWARHQCPSPPRRRRRARSQKLLLEHPWTQRRPGCSTRLHRDPEHDEAKFDLVLRSNRDELLQQLQRINGNQDATATLKRWAHGPIGIHDVCAAVSQQLFDHCQSAQLAHHLPCKPAPCEQQARLYCGRCKTLGRNPWLGSCRSCQFFDFSVYSSSFSCHCAKALLAGKVPFQHMFFLKTREYAISEEGVHIWELPVHHFPGPPWNPNQWYLWRHGTTPQGLVGILTA